MQKEKLSALMDGELLDTKLVSSLSGDSVSQQSWQSYHLIRDALRGDIGKVIHLNIADCVSAALEKEPVYRCDPQTITPQPQPHPWGKRSFGAKIRPWGSQLMQVGVAASVALAVVVGVQYYEQPTTQVEYFESPAFNTMPIIGRASQVSLGVPANDLSFGSGQQQSTKEQHQRINAMLQDYELQRRLYSEAPPLENGNTHPQETFEVIGPNSLGIQ